MGSSESPSLKDELAFFIVRSPDAVQILVNELVTRPPFLWTSIEIASLGWLTWMEKIMSGQLIGARQRSLSKSMCRDPGSQTSQRYFGHLVSLRQGFMTLIGPQVSKPICVALSLVHNITGLLHHFADIRHTPDTSLGWQRRISRSISLGDHYASELALFVVGHWRSRPMGFCVQNLDDALKACDTADKEYYIHQYNEADRQPPSRRPPSSHGR